MLEKILIVDDNVEFRKELKTALEDRFEAFEAGDGRQALEILSRANEIGAVVLDVNMPGLTGTEVLKELKKSQPDLGVLILTGYGSKDTAIESLKSHADDYLEKPVEIPDIKRSLERLFQKRHSEDIDTSSLKGKIEKVKYFTIKNCYRKIALSDAATAVGLSQKYLSRVFKQYTGTSYSQFRLKTKIDSAKKLLSRPEHNINFIAAKLGFRNAETFIRQFKKLNGCTATEYRKKIASPAKGSGPGRSTKKARPH